MTVSFHRRAFYRPLFGCTNFHNGFRFVYLGLFHIMVRTD